MQTDRFYKMRPIFTHVNQVMNLNNKFKEKFISVNKITIPYYDQHGNK